MARGECFTSPTMRSSLGKRSFNDYEVDNNAFLQPATVPEASYTPPSEPEQPRRVVTMLYTTYEAAKYFLTYIASYFTQPRQITAVSTSPQGNKRRAIEADASTASPAMATPEIPSRFPEPSHAMTPPSSRRNSTSPKDSLSPAAQQQQPQEMAKQSPSTTAQPKKNKHASSFAELFPQLAVKTFEENCALYKHLPDKRFKHRKAKQPAPAESPKPSPYVPTALRNAHARKKQEEQKDDKIDGLIERAKKATIGSPDSQKTREYYNRRVSLRESIRKQEEDKAAKVQAEKEEAEALKKAEEEAKRQAEEAVEEAKKQAEAEKQAEAARKASFDEKQKLIRPLEPKWADALAQAMAHKEHAKVADGVGGNDITQRDFATLLANPGQDTAKGWLNDEIVNAWFQTIVRRKQDQDGYVKSAKNVPAYVAYNTAWILTYKNKGNSVEGLKTWSRRQGIQGEKLLRAQKIFFPINTGAHWMLLIIHPQTKTIEFLDSLHNMHGGQGKIWFKIARQWLAMELGKQYKEEEWTDSKAQSSLQTNGNDCGALTCFNALAAAKGRGYEEVSAEKMQDARRLMGAVLLNGGFEGDFEL